MAKSLVEEKNSQRSVVRWICKLSARGEYSGEDPSTPTSYLSCGVQTEERQGTAVLIVDKTVDRGKHVAGLPTGFLNHD